MATGFEDLPEAASGASATGFEDLPAATSGRSAPSRFARGLAIGLRSAGSNLAKQAELAGLDSARDVSKWMEPTERPEGFAGKLGAAAGNVAGLAPEFLVAGLVSTAATGTPIPGIAAAGAASGAGGAKEG